MTQKCMIAGIFLFFKIKKMIGQQEKQIECFNIDFIYNITLTSFV